jgi:hypothetical protein
MNTKPDYLPPLPVGAFYLGRSGEFKTLSYEIFSGWFMFEGEPSWGVIESLDGGALKAHYAAPADSEIARLNGSSAHRPASIKHVVGSTEGGSRFAEFDSLELAEAEAQRLARLHPNNAFSVYAKVCSFIASTTVTKL